MKKQMFYNAQHLIFQRAKELRNKPTHAESILWFHLRTRPGEYKFRRQHPVGNYIADFYCHALKLVIEADGSIHDDPDVRIADEERQKNMQEEGLFFLRFTNHQITHQLEKVIEKINEAITHITSL